MTDFNDEITDQLGEMYDAIVGMANENGWDAGMMTYASLQVAGSTIGQYWSADRERAVEYLNNWIDIGVGLKKMAEAQTTDEGTP